MLFRNAFKNLPPRFSSNLTLRFKSAQADVKEPGTGGAGALVAAVGTTFGTYMLADFLSNFLQHPTQAVSEITQSILYFFLIALLC